VDSISDDDDTDRSSSAVSTDVDTAPGAASTPDDDVQVERPLRARVILSVVVLVAFLAVGTRLLMVTSERNDLQERTEQLEESLRIARGDAGAQIEMLEDENSALQAQVADLESQLATITTEFDSVRAEADDLAQRLDERRAERDEALEQVEELEDQLDEIGPRFAPMPLLVGSELDAAEEFADEIGAELLVEEVAPTNVIARPGAIIEQLPLDGTTVLPGTVIWVQVYTPDNGDD
jgi:septal ring factor EnvC (AmiA/AmiB activator)